MKQVILILMLLYSCMLCKAQSTSLTVDNQTPGWLSSKINYGDQQTVVNLTITGYVNQTDLNFIGDLMSKHKLSGHLNLTEAEVVDVKFMDSPTSIGGSLSMFNLAQKVSLTRFSVPKSISSISPYLLARVQADTLDYGSNRCEALTKFLVTNRYYGTNYCPKVLILRDGVTKIEVFGTDEGNEKDLQTIIFPESLDSIGKNAFSGCTNLKDINLPNNIRIIDEGAFAGTSFCPDTLYLPSALKIYNTNSFPIKNGQTIILGSNVSNFNNRSWYLRNTTNATYIINRVVPPTFTKGASGNSYSNGKELVGCTLYVPSEGYSMYIDPEYNSVGTGGTWSGWSNPYSHAKVKTIHIPVENITISQTSTSLNVGNSVQLIASVLPSNADNKSISWTSSNINVANVNANGLVTGVSCGSAIITATSIASPNLYVCCDVTVHQPLQSISLNTTNLTLTAGQVYDGLTVKYYPTTADNKSLTWKSTNPEVASVDDNGKITAKSGGETKVIVSSVENSNIKTECSIIVVQPVTGISLNTASLDLIEEESTQLVASILPESASNKNVNWTSSDISIAMVSPDGTVYAIKTGQATIMATTVDGGFIALCKVTVKPKTTYISEIKLSINSETLAVGETLQLNAIISPENASNKIVNWTSTNPSIANVNATGLVTAIAEGETQIIATTSDGSNLSAICKINVNKRFITISQIQITPSSVRIPVGKTMNLNVTISPNDATHKILKWSSTNPSVVTVSEDGIVSAISDGDAIVIASTQDGSNLSATCQVEVFTETVLVDCINLDIIKINGLVNDTFTIKAIVSPTNATNKNIKWTTSDENIVSVDNGAVKLLAPGRAIITAEAMDGSNVKSECTVIVSHEAGLDFITMDKESYIKIYNLSGYLIYEGIYSEASLSPGFYIVICNGVSYKTKVD
ncbi:MAG: leucine-rich repeat protein [Bacteroides sp.]|nr:leucine-rich repeat protein [Bacteroides sp.]